MRRPRARPRQSSSRGAPDPALRTLRSVRRELCWTAGAGSLRFASAARGERGQASPRPRAKTPRWSAGRRASRSQGTRRRKASTDMVAPFGAPSPRTLSAGAARPATGRRIKSPRSDHACLREIPELMRCTERDATALIPPPCGEGGRAEAIAERGRVGSASPARRTLLLHDAPHTPPGSRSDSLRANHPPHKGEG
jgi:hypothetical protein